MKLAVLTGTSRGLGYALAAELPRHGVRVVGTSRATGVDVTVPEQVQGWASMVLTEYGPPDLLLNNAAIINRNAPLWEISPEEFGRILDVNLKGIHHVLSAFLPAMIERGSGVVVNFSSTWGRTTSPEVAPYCCTKWGVEGLTRALAQELPPGMAAVAFNPGVIDTQMLQSCFGSSAAGYMKPKDWATQAAPFLLGLGREHNGRSLSL